MILLLNFGRTILTDLGAVMIHISFSGEFSSSNVSKAELALSGLKSNWVLIPLVILNLSATSSSRKSSSSEAELEEWLGIWNNKKTAVWVTHNLIDQVSMIITMRELDEKLWRVAIFSSGALKTTVSQTTMCSYLQWMPSSYRICDYNHIWRFLKFQDVEI